MASEAPGADGALRVATASNFRPAMEALGDAFHAAGGAVVTPVFGSTGKLHAQILNGAPFDAFFAADAERPARLEAAGATVPGTRFTYARGVLVLYSPAPGLVDGEGGVLRGGAFEHLAIANPRLAPYGRAAVETLERLGLRAALAPRTVMGENVGQAMAFVMSGNAELGFVALSQVLGPAGAPLAGSHWRVPGALHGPIEQQAVLLRDTAAGRAFLEFVRGDAGRAIIEARGYLAP